MQNSAALWWRRSYPRKDCCCVGTDKVEIHPAICLTEYNGLWWHVKVASLESIGDSGFLSPSPIGFNHHRYTPQF